MGVVAIGVKVFIVHGGHFNVGDDFEIGIDNWRKTFVCVVDEGGFGIRVLIENTVGGNNVMVWWFDWFVCLWDVIGEFDVGFCLDICYVHVGGEELVGVVECVCVIIGCVDLVYVNDSCDVFDFGADWYVNLGFG